MKRHVTLAVAFVALVALAGCMGVFGGDSTDPVEYVPSDANSIAHVDMAIAQDSDTKTLANAFASQAPSDVNDTQDAFAEFENETGLDAKKVSGVTLYTLPNEDAEDYTDPQEFAGFVVASEWNEDDFINALESEQSYSYTSTTDGDVTVYAPDTNGTSFSEPAHIAAVGDGTFIVGDEEAVTAAVDVANGDADAVSGDLKNGFEQVNDGHVTFAYEVASSDVPESNPNQQIDTSAFKDVSVVAGSYGTNDGTVTVESKLFVDSEDAATDVADVTDGAVSMVSGTAANEDVKDQLRSVEVTQDGDVVTVTYEGNVDTLAQLIEDYMSQTQSPTTTY